MPMLLLVVTVTVPLFRGFSAAAAKRVPRAGGMPGRDPPLSAGRGRRRGGDVQSVLCIPLGINFRFN
jgi:hypothetical protein